MRGIRLATALLVLAVTTGCGGGGDEGTAPPPAVPSPGATSAAPSSSPASTAQPDPGTSARPTAPQTPTDEQQKKQLSKLAACMKKHGIDIPTDPSQTFTPPPGYDPVKAQKALQECLPAVSPR
ncbi:hypothetical protein [Actinocorallia longicatena]|uniref:Secreted protein n=1 Tax=Actinocorallia longicatena TaxID=111803 RepID=A0ABP6QAK7_9ACTN